MAAKLGAEEIVSKIIHLALEKQEITDKSVSNRHKFQLFMLSYL